MQEKLKGRTDLAPRCDYGGWGRAGWGDGTPVPADFLKATPFFNDDPPAGPDLYDAAKGSDFASPAHNRNRLLAEMLPARTLAAGRVAVINFNQFGTGRNFDMSTAFRNGWPAERFAEDKNRWRHSDYRQVAYLYVWPLYDQFKVTGKLDQ